MTQLAATLITLFERSRLSGKPQEYPLQRGLRVRVRYTPEGHRQLMAWRDQKTEPGDLELSILARDGGLGDQADRETFRKGGITHFVLTAQVPEEIQP